MGFGVAYGGGSEIKKLALRGWVSIPHSVAAAELAGAKAGQCALTITISHGLWGWAPPTTWHHTWRCTNNSLLKFHEFRRGFLPKQQHESFLLVLFCKEKKRSSSTQPASELPGNSETHGPCADKPISTESWAERLIRGVL